ncbi:hypothetical protein [Vibrio diabolicus]|uniref:hypothetical protein n=1 Tax=Vibrio diabolicus TaxID=50719 RepID=UPI00142823C1|nr:hypothetical protein [Vibrio diabolicus]QIR97554.1 hypothetical protein FR741_07265 [Vibrio diabolicus]
MIITSNNQDGIELHDFGVGYLKGVLESLDSSLMSINKEIESSSVWEVESYCDHGEYLIGVGFCVMQRYLFDVLQDIQIDPGLARDLGPRTSNGVAVGRLIHSAANYWKHAPEWHIWLQELKPKSQKTIDEVLHSRDSADYPLSDLLSDLNGSSELTLTGCLPHLIHWRKAVFEHIKKNV